MSTTAKNERALSPSVLNTSSNLLGLCFVILSYIKASGRADLTHIDECLAAPIVLFFGSSLFSYLAIRTTEKKGQPYEQKADWFFIGGMITLTMISLALVFQLFV
jgi:hypothetical protein